MVYFQEIIRKFSSVSDCTALGWPSSSFANQVVSRQNITCIPVTITITQSKGQSSYTAFTGRHFVIPLKLLTTSYIKQENTNWLTTSKIKLRKCFMQVHYGTLRCTACFHVYNLLTGNSSLEENYSSSKSSSRSLVPFNVLLQVLLSTVLWYSNDNKHEFQQIWYFWDIPTC